MKILWFENMVNGEAYRYYWEMLRNLESRNDIDIKIVSNWNAKQYNTFNYKDFNYEADLIVFGFGVMNSGLNMEFMKLNGADDIPRVVMLNKEYGIGTPEFNPSREPIFLEAKLKWTKEVAKPFVCFSYHHSYKDFEAATGIPFVNLPFGVNETVFYDRKQDYEWDVAFTGGTGKPRQQWSHGHRSMFFDELQGELNSKGLRTLFQPHMRDSSDEYSKKLCRAKIWLSTTGPLDIVGTRYFELMATNTTLLACNRHGQAYDGILEEGKHCIMFDTKEELAEKIDYYLANEDERMKIVNSAHEHALKNHTYNTRADKFLESINEYR